MDKEKRLSFRAVLDDVRELVRLYDSLMGNEILRHACKNEYQLHEYNKFKFLFEKVRAHVV